MSDSKLTKHGLRAVIKDLVEEIQMLYAEDDVPWVIGYSGGKDSTAILQMVWMALEALPSKQRSKKVHVISTDTLVENPVVSAWVERSHRVMRKVAQERGIPIEPHRLTPDVDSTFWVNLIGRGYPAPRPKFRWCTERLKIKPSNKFITDVVRSYGQAILVLGTRKAESQLRARTMAKHEIGRVRDRLSPNGSLPGSLVYTPIEDWSNDDVWLFLTQVENPWGWSNHQLMGMYAGATEGGECPLVVDTSTPSCGDSRFGCWVCTLVDKDKSMSAMIQNDVEKEWMLPLLELRQRLDMRDKEGFRGDTINRDFRRIDGRLTLERHPKEQPATEKERRSAVKSSRELAARFRDVGRIHAHEDDTVYYLVHGPYLQRWREDFLRQVLEAQVWVRKNGPAHVRDLELISLPELEQIRKLWVLDKHEVEDSLPRIYRLATGEEYPGRTLDDYRPFSPDDLKELRSICLTPETPESEEDESARLQYELVRNLLDVERRYRTRSRRSGLYDDIEKLLMQAGYSSETDALRWAMQRKEAASAGETHLHTLQQQVMPIVLEPELVDDGQVSTSEDTP